MIDFSGFIRPHIKSMLAYQPILPVDVLSELLGMPVKQIIKLDANENPYGLLPEIKQDLVNMPYPHIYPDPESRVLRRHLAAHHDIPLDSILAGAGADELIDLVMRLSLDPGDRIIDCPPTFGMYRFDAAVNNANVIPIPRLDDFSIDFERVQQSVFDYQPKLLFLASPNNPDGNILSKEIIHQLLRLPILVVIDEAYIDFANQEESSINLVSEQKNLIVLRTFSKWAGLAGLRVGYGVFPDWMTPYLWKIKQPYNVSVAATAAALSALNHHAQLAIQLEAIKNERERMFAALKSIPWLKPYPSEANFILCQVVGRSAYEIRQSLADSGILVRLFDHARLTDHIRISVGKPEQTDKLLNLFHDLE